MDNSLERLAYDLSLRSLDKQEEVLVPKRELRFSLAGPALYERLYGFRDDVPEVHRRLAYEFDLICASNQRIMVGFFRAFWLVALALLAEVVLLLASMGGTLL